MFEHWFSYTIPLTHFKGIIEASSGICVLTSISIFSNLVECVDFSDLSGATESWFTSFFRINNIELKIFVCPVPKMSQVRIKWPRRASDHGRFTFWHNGLQAALLGRFTLWHNGRRATQLGRFTLCDTEWTLSYTTRYWDLLCGGT